MSAPGSLFKDAKYISLSFLADNTSEALEALAEKKGLNKEHRESLRKAALFLRDAASGADFVSTGRSKAAFDASASLEALNYAMGPIESRRGFLPPPGQDPSAFFTKLASTMDKASGAAAASLPAEELVEAHTFFVNLFDWLQTELDTRRPKTGAFRRKASAYA